jgi:integrase
MLVRLDAFNVKTLPVGEHRDDLVRGFVLRVRAGGARSFAIFYWRGGEKKRYNLGPLQKLPLTTARDEARKLLARVALGEDPQAIRAAARQAELTVDGLVAGCLGALEVRPKTRTEWARLAEVEISPAIGALPAAQVTRTVIRDWGASITKRSGWVANRSWELLRRAYSWGVSQDLLVGSPFVHGFTRPMKVEPPSTRVLSGAEVGALWRALGPDDGQFADAVRLLLLTLTRRGMVVGMRLGELELESPEPRWTVPGARTKNGKDHVVPLVPAAVEVIRRRLERANGDALFPPARPAEVQPEVMWWSSRWNRGLVADVEAQYREAAQLAPRKPRERPLVARWTIHNLRHTAATHMAEDLGVDEGIIALLLAHSQRSTSAVTQRYVRAERRVERRRALEAWCAWIAAQAASRAVVDEAQQTA